MNKRKISLTKPVYIAALLTFALYTPVSNASWMAISNATSTVDPDSAELGFRVENWWDGTGGDAFARAEATATYTFDISQIPLAPLQSSPFTLIGQLEPGPLEDGLPTVQIITINSSYGGTGLQVSPPTLEANANTLAIAISDIDLGENVPVVPPPIPPTVAASSRAEAEDEGMPGLPISFMFGFEISGLFEFTYTPAGGNAQTTLATFGITPDSLDPATPEATESGIDDFMFNFNPATWAFNMSGNVDPGLTITGPGTLTMSFGLVGILHSQREVLKTSIPEPSGFYLILSGTLILLGFPRNFISRR